MGFLSIALPLVSLQDSKISPAVNNQNQLHRSFPGNGSDITPHLYTALLSAPHNTDLSPERTEVAFTHHALSNALSLMLLRERHINYHIKNENQVHQPFWDLVVTSLPLPPLQSLIAVLHFRWLNKTVSILDFSAHFRSCLSRKE